MTGLDRALRVSGAILALSLSLAALSVAWAATTRTTPTAVGWVVARENLITGDLKFCDPQGCKSSEDWSDLAAPAE